MGLAAPLYNFLEHLESSFEDKCNKKGKKYRNKEISAKVDLWYEKKYAKTAKFLKPPLVQNYEIY